MRFSWTGRRLVGSAGALLSVLALGGAAAARQADSAAALSPRAVVATAADVIPEPVPSTALSSTTSTSITSISSTSSTSTSISMSTSTTVKPAATPTPTPATTPRVTSAPAVPPPTALVTEAPSEVHGKNSDPAERCAKARQWVAAHGLVLPAGWGFRCPGSAVLGGAPRWGLACWNCEGNGSWIAVDAGRIGPSEATLRHVIAHEICHAIEYATLGLSTEPTADLCAARHGAPRP